MKSNYWRTNGCTYIHCLTGEPIRNSQEHQKKRNTRKYHEVIKKLMAKNRETGMVSTAVIMENGSVYIGPDVWRLSNKADSCEYASKYFSKQVLAELEYELYEPSSPYSSISLEGGKISNEISQYHNRRYAQRHGS